MAKIKPSIAYLSGWIRGLACISSSFSLILLSHRHMASPFPCRARKECLSLPPFHLLRRYVRARSRAPVRACVIWAGWSSSSRNARILGNTSALGCPAKDRGLPTAAPGRAQNRSRQKRAIHRLLRVVCCEASLLPPPPPLADDNADVSSAF